MISTILNNFAKVSWTIRNKCFMPNFANKGICNERSQLQSHAIDIDVKDATSPSSSLKRKVSITAYSEIFFFKCKILFL